MKLFRTTFREAGVLMWVHNLECPPPKFYEGKKRPNFGAISDNFRLWSRISPESIDISKIGKSSWSTTTHPRSPKESCWTLIHKRKSYRGAYWPAQVDIFRDNISALRGCCTIEFSHALEVYPGCLPHSPTGTGVPQKNLIAKKLKFTLKFSMCAHITSGLVGVCSRNFSGRRAARQGC